MGKGEDRMKAPKQWARTSAAMYDAMTRLRTAGITFARCSEHQLKVGEWNFYPNTGSLYADDQPPLKERGIETLLQVLSRRHADGQQTTSMRDAIVGPGSHVP